MGLVENIMRLLEGHIDILRWFHYPNHQKQRMYPSYSGRTVAVYPVKPMGVVVSGVEDTMTMELGSFAASRQVTQGEALLVFCQQAYVFRARNWW